jgi:hypothetical protein
LFWVLNFDCGNRMRWGNIASSWQCSIRARPPLDHTRPLNPELTRARIESLCKVGRFSSATRVCRKLDGHLKGNPPALQPSLDALAILIEQLRSPENDRDLLPDDSLEPPLMTSAVCSLQSAVYCLMSIVCCLMSAVYCLMSAV